MFWSRKISLFVFVIPKNLYYSKPGNFLPPGNKHISQVYLAQNYINKFTQEKEPYLPLNQWLLCDAVILLKGLSLHLKWLKFQVSLSVARAQLPTTCFTSGSLPVQHFWTGWFTLAIISYLTFLLSSPYGLTLWFQPVISLFRKFQWLPNFR